MNDDSRRDNNVLNVVVIVVIIVLGMLFYLSDLQFSSDVRLIEQSLNGTGDRRAASGAELYTAASAVTTGRVVDSSAAGTATTEAAGSHPPQATPAEAVRAGHNLPPASADRAASRSRRTPQRGAAPADEWPESGRKAQADDPYAIAGRVLNQAGEAVPGIALTARPRRLFAADGSDAPAAVTPQRAVSDFDGRYRFAQLAEGEYQIDTAAGGRYGAARTVVRTGIDSADLVLAEQWRLTVQGVINDDAGLPLSGVRVVSAGGGSGTASSDEQGGYRMMLEIDDSRQSHLLRYRLDGYREQSLRIGREDWRSVEHLLLDVVMEPAYDVATVTGSIRNARADPLAGAAVSLFSHRLGTRYRGSSDRSGRFVIDGVELADDYRLQVRPQGAYRDYKRKGLAVTANGVDLAITLEPVSYASVFGLMMDQHGNPLPHLDLWVRGRDARGTKVPVSGDGQGYFEVNDAPDGALIFETQSMPKLSVMGVDVAAGAEKSVNLVLDWGDYRLQGFVFDSQGQPLSLPRILLTWSHNGNGLHSTSLRRTASDAEGYFDFSKLGPGRHKVTIEAPGFRRLDRELEVRFGDNVIELTLESKS